MPSRFSTDYRNLRPYVLEDVRAIVSAGSSNGGSAALTAHRLNDTTIHLGQLDPSQATWALTATTGVPSTRQVVAGAGLTGGGALSGDVTLTVGAGYGITVNADDVALASTVAGAGLTYTTGVIAVGVANTGAAGLTVEADLVRLTSSSNPGAAASVLASDAAGALTLTTLTASTKLRSPLLDTASGNLTLQPAGDITIDPVGNDVLPATNYDINLGALSKKYLTLHAAELWVETLVAQNTIATIGGRILVGPTTTLTRDLAAAATTIYVKHNQMISGDRAYMEANGSVEFFAITSGATNTGTDYSYTVTRNLDGTGANDWYAGDAMFNTGQTGNGFIDLYSVRGVKAATQYGPTIVGNVRTGSTYNAWAERWAIGNLNGLYGYGVDTYGFAAGDPAGVWLAADATNGLRMMNSSQTRLLLSTAGNLRLYDPSGTPVISLDNDGTSYFAGVMTIGTSGEIRQGTGTLGSNYTGLRIWRDGNVGRIGGYNADALQWYANTDGKLYAGGGKVTLGATGLSLQAETAEPTTPYTKITWAATLPTTGITGEIYSSRSAALGNWVAVYAYDDGLQPGGARLAFGAKTNGGFNAGLTVSSYHSGGVWYDSWALYGGDGTINGDVFVSGEVSAATIVSGAGIKLGNYKIYSDAEVQMRNVADSANQGMRAKYIYSVDSVWYSASMHQFRDASSGNYNTMRSKAHYIESSTDPGAGSSAIGLWWDGTNLRATLPGGTTKTFTWT